MEGLVQGDAAQSDREKDSEIGVEIKYSESKYRWVVVGLMGCSLVVSGLANNPIIPL